jgi:aryl-alcohol dehydrogenase-like predicted oxidoreductase
MVSLIRATIERGADFFEPAEVGSPYTSEDLLGEALVSFHGEVTIATKFGFKIKVDLSPSWDGLVNRPALIRAVVGRGHRPALSEPR